ncbi:MAG: DUF1554 domain-containing protein [Bdellovibrionota bacterium]
MRIKPRFIHLSALSLFLLCGCELIDGSGAAAPITEDQGCTTCRIFVSATTTQGDFGGAEQADTICDVDANNPNDGATFKALMYDAGVREACTTDMCSGSGVAEHIDWVLKSNTDYTRLDGTPIATADANGLLPDTLTNAISATSATVWHGILYQESVMLIPAQRWMESGDNCNGWVDNSNSRAGRIGIADQVNNSYINAGNPVCQNTYSFYCVEQ